MYKITRSDASVIFRALRLAWCVLLVTLANTGLARAGDFRDFDWGATSKAVLQKEGAQPDPFLGAVSLGRLVYPFKDGPGNGYQSIVTFVFDTATSKLDEGRYGNIARKPRKGTISANVSLEDFEYFSDVLTKKYGKPYESSRDYKSAVGKVIPDRFALEMGWLTLANAWVTPKSLIIQTLQKETLGIAHNIRYIDQRAVTKKAEQAEEWSDFLKAAQKGLDPSIGKDL